MGTVQLESICQCFLSIVRELVAVRIQVFGPALALCWHDLNTQTKQGCYRYLDYAPCTEWYVCAQC